MHPGRGGAMDIGKEVWGENALLFHAKASAAVVLQGHVFRIGPSEKDEGQKDMAGRCALVMISE